MPPVTAVRDISRIAYGRLLHGDGHPGALARLGFRDVAAQPLITEVTTLVTGRAPGDAGAAGSLHPDSGGR